MGLNPYVIIAAIIVVSNIMNARPFKSAETRHGAIRREVVLQDREKFSISSTYFELQPYDHIHDAELIIASIGIA